MKTPTWTFSVVLYDRTPQRTLGFVVIEDLDEFFHAKPLAVFDVIEVDDCGNETAARTTKDLITLVSFAVTG
jgi:hypothetical protein